MTFTISSRGQSYTFPIDPQHWSFSPTPRFATKKTFGGQVVQLLGYTINGSFSGLLNGGMVSRQQAWNDMSILKSFMTSVMLNQKNGLQSSIYWPDEDIAFDCALGDLNISESLQQTGMTYSISFYAVSKSAIRDGRALSSLLGMLMENIGYNGQADQWHGANGTENDQNALLSDAIASITPISDFSEYGPSASSPSSSGVTTSVDATVSAEQAYAKSQMSKYGWTDRDYADLVTLWNHESSWSSTAKNPSSSAYGIPQALTDMHNLEGTSYMTDPKAQIDWGLNYIKGRYGSPSAAWSFWSQNRWY